MSAALWLFPGGSNNVNPEYTSNSKGHIERTLLLKHFIFSTNVFMFYETFNNLYMKII